LGAKTLLNRSHVICAWNLHQLTLNKSLDCFVIFSSATSLLGSPGQSNHVTANTFLDSLAHYRKAMGLPVISINWGLWSEIGAAARKKAKFKGVGLISPDEGIKILDQLTTEKVTQVGVVPIDWGQFPYKTAFFDNFVQYQTPLTPIEANFLQDFLGLPSEEQRPYLIAYLRSQLSQVLGFDPSEIDMEKGFFDLGMDSLTAVEFKNRLQNDLTITLPSTVAFDYPNGESLANYLMETIVNTTATSAEESEQLIDLSEDDLADLLAQELSEIEEEKNYEL
jgi:acyl carrier protein